MGHKFRIENWIDGEQASSLEGFDYWNNELEEEGKEWNVLDGDFSKMESYLARSGLLSDLNKCVSKVRQSDSVNLGKVGIDLAAGNSWTIPTFAKLDEVETIYSLEYSKHRLTKLSPYVLSHYNVSPEKVILAYGSFYDVKLADSSVDFVLLSQAYHHAEKPKELLKEIKRILKSDGVVIVIGERNINVPMACCKHMIKYVLGTLLPKKLKNRLFPRMLKPARLIPNVRKDILVPEHESGDYLYSFSDYLQMFQDGGFEVYSCSKNREHHSFILTNQK